MAAGNNKIVTELSLEGKELIELPPKVAERCGNTLIKLDLTENSIATGRNFEGLTALEQLVLDKNSLAELVGYPQMSKVHTLWLNNNKITDLDRALDRIREAFPNVTYLSMLFNPCVPNVFMDDSAATAYQRYRYQVISKLPRIQFLDSTPVSPEERKEAGRVVVARPTAQPPGSSAGASAAATPKQQISTTPPRASAFLTKVAPRADGNQSEGNRFITNDMLG